MALVGNLHGLDGLFAECPDATVHFVNGDELYTQKFIFISRQQHKNPRQSQLVEVDSIYLKNSANILLMQDMVRFDGYV